MQFIVMGLDHPNALERRMAQRQAHIDVCGAMKADGRMLYGVALLNDEGQMCGSMIVLDLPDRAAVDEYLKTEPYVTGDVWGEIKVTQCKVGPSFAKPAG
ncbi:MAG TPA: YciI family protein [Patescibacteria group bacterium]|nr:YciI family protein [Patescibacteria group bacterium]